MEEKCFSKKTLRGGIFKIKKELAVGVTDFIAIHCTVFIIEATTSAVDKCEGFSCIKICIFVSDSGHKSWDSSDILP